MWDKPYYLNRPSYGLSFDILFVNFPYGRHFVLLYYQSCRFFQKIFNLLMYNCTCTSTDVYLYKYCTSDIKKRYAQFHLAL